MKLKPLVISNSLLTGIFALVLLQTASAADDPLPSWADTAPKRKIVSFVERVTKVGGSDFVPVPERIATFDNDGTLWTEVLDGDMKALAATGEEGLYEILVATHAGVTTDEFAQIVSDWLATAEQPRFERRYTKLVYEPMLELLSYLRENDFKTYIVSGGGVEFMRAFADRVYGIPREHVIGSTVVTQFQIKDGKPVLTRLPKADFINDKAGKPVGINKFIGLRPIFAFGNSDGDQQMLEWTAAGFGARFVGLVHHTDAKREYAYDRQSPIGRLDKVLDEANAKGWTIVSMKDDWKTVFPPGR
jgi:phosphoserine phosphatase